jgi:hypothetical protein
MRARTVPPVTIQLGTVLDAELEHEGQRIRIDEWKGYQILADDDAFRRRPPHARLFLVRGKIEKLAHEPSSTRIERGLRDYERWHRRPYDRLGELDTKEAKYLQGRLVTIGYRSDKWGPRGKRHDYTHSFHEDGGRPPLVYSSARTLAGSHTIVVVGGSMRITERGIA